LTNRQIGPYLCERVLNGSVLVLERPLDEVLHGGALSRCVRLRGHSTEQDSSNVSQIKEVSDFTDFKRSQNGNL
jgi:hypothetical protein